jgi:hypothetical protein
MSQQIDLVVRPTAKPVVAGVFNIIIGGFCVLGALIMGIGALVFISAGGNMFGGIPVYAGFGILLIAILVIALGALSVIGGVMSLQRRTWGWALAGSIAAAFISTLFGLASIILIAISKDEFAK